MTRERSRTRMPWSIDRGPSATLEESFGHRIDLGDPRARDGIDARLDLGERLERLGRHCIRIGAHLLGETASRDDAMHETERLGLGRRVAAALHDDLLRAGRTHE